MWQAGGMKTRSSSRRGSATQAASRRPAASRKRGKSVPAPTPERILQFAWGYAPPLILETAVDLRVFDLLEAGPQTAEGLSKKTGASLRGLKALLNALVGLNFLKRKGPRYALTPESDMFLVSRKLSFHGGLFHHMVRQVMPTWMSLTEAVASGRPVTAVNAQTEGAD